MGGLRELDVAFLEKAYAKRGVNVKYFPTRQEWLDFRTFFIGGSDASCILGLNPWKSNRELWNEKANGEKQTVDNDLMKYGREAETFIRGLFSLDHPEYGVIDGTDIILLNPKYPWAHASLDGHLADRETGELVGIWECKTVSVQNADTWQKWHKKVPDYYYCQILHYMAVTELDLAILRAQIRAVNEDGTIYAQMREYTFKREDVQGDIDTLMNAEKAFYECIVEKREPNVILPQI